MTIITIIGTLRAGGKIQRAGFAGYWLVSRSGRKRPLPVVLFHKLEARGQLARVTNPAAAQGAPAQWGWSGKQPFMVPKLPRGRCASGG